MRLLRFIFLQVFMNFMSSYACLVIFSVLFIINYIIMCAAVKCCHVLCNTVCTMATRAPIVLCATLQLCLKLSTLRLVLMTCIIEASNEKPFLQNAYLDIFSFNLLSRDQFINNLWFPSNKICRFSYQSSFVRLSS